MDQPGDAHTDPGEASAHAPRANGQRTTLLERDLAVALGSTRDLPTALDAVLRAVLSVDDVDCGGVYLVDEFTGDIELVAHAGVSPQFVECASHYAPDSANARVIDAGVPLYQDYEQIARLVEAGAERQFEGLRAAAVIPVRYEGRTIAALNLASHSADVIADGSRAVIEALAAQIGGAVARVRAERALEASRADLELLFESLDDFLFVLDETGRILRVNRVVLERLRYTPEELIGEHVLSVHPPDRRDEAMAIISAMLAGEATHCPVPVITKDGIEIPVETRVRPGTWAGRPALFGISRDVSERVAAEREVRSLNESLESRVRELSVANRELQDFVYSVSHDLRSPLRAVDGFSLSVLEDHGDDIGDQGRSDLARVRAAAQRMGDLIDALLSLTSITRLSVESRETDLSAIAAGIVVALGEAEPGRIVELSISAGVVARTDPRLVAVVLENLLANAWKFTAHSSPARIAFGVSELDGRRVYSVSDNGVGFDAAYGDKLFRPFQRLHTAEEFPGTGIGLATVGRVLDRLGGEYWAEGAPGAGATVYFTLP
jgi:PAS domain S-box-containing protein